MTADQVELPEGQDSFKLNEVCKLANVQPYMLRFWGTEFDNLEAEKTGTGQRVYTREQVELILEVRRLLFEEGLTIAGTRKKINAKKAAAEPKPRKKPSRAGKAAQTDKKDESEKSEAAAKSVVESGPSREEVDKAIRDRVQPLLATLKDVRGEVAKLLSELKQE